MQILLHHTNRNGKRRVRQMRAWFNSTRTGRDSRPISLRFCETLNRCCQRDFLLIFLFFSPFPSLFHSLLQQQHTQHNSISSLDSGVFEHHTVRHSARHVAHGSCEFSCCTTSKRHSTLNWWCSPFFISERFCVSRFFYVYTPKCSSTRCPDNGKCLCGIKVRLTRPACVSALQKKKWKNPCSGHDTERVDLCGVSSSLPKVIHPSKWPNKIIFTILSSRDSNFLLNYDVTEFSS